MSTSVNAQTPTVDTLTVDINAGFVIVTGSGGTPGGTGTVVITSGHAPPIHPPSGGWVDFEPDGTFYGEIPLPAGVTTFSGGVENAGIVDDTSGGGSETIFGVSPSGVGHALVRTIFSEFL